MTQHYKFDDWRNGSAWQTPQMTGHAVATAGAQTPPDAWAEYRTIADQLGTSPASVASAPEVYRRRLQEKQAAGQLQGAPQLKQWLDWNPADQASVSDDLENLARIEKESGLWNPAAGAVEGAARVQEYGGKSLARGALSAASGAVQATAHGELYQMEVLPQLRGLSEDEAFDLLYPPLPEEMQQVFPSGYAARREEERKEFQRTYAPLWQIANSEDGGAAYMARLKEGARSTLEIAGAIRAYREADWLAMSPGAQDFARRFDEVNDPDASTTDQMLSTLQLFVEDPTNGASFAAQIFGESLPAIGMAFGASAIAGPGAGVAALGAGVVSQEIDAVTAELYLEQGIDIRTKEGIDRILNDPALARDAQERGVLKGLIIASVDMATMGAGGLASRALTANPALDILFQTSANVIGGGGGEYVGSVAAGLDVSGGEILLEGVLELPGTVPDVVFGRTQFKDREAELRRQAQRGQLERAGAAAADSRTRQRLQGVVQRVVEEGLGGAEASVSVPVDAVDEYFQSIGQPVDPEMLGTTAEELASLRATGGDIQIPMGHYLDRIAGSEHLQFFLENTVLDSKDLTPQERMRFSEQMQDAVDTEVRAITRERDDATVEIFDRVYSQSLEGGRLTPIEAQANAEMVSRLVMTGAERTSLDPLEVFERMAPILRREGFAVPEDASRPTRRYVANERRARLSGELDSLRAMTEDTPVADVDQEQLQDLLDELGIDATGQDIAAAIELVEGLAKPQADPTAAVTSAGEVVPGPSASPAGGLSPTAQLLAQQLEQRGLDINELTNEEIIDALGMADDDVFFQTVALRTGDEDLRVPSEGKTPTTREVAAALERRARRRYKTIERGDYSARASTRIANWMFDEVMFEVAFAEQNPEKSAVGWYSSKFQTALDSFGSAFPELVGDMDMSLPGVALLGTQQNARDFFTALVAITSDGAKVHDNFRFASQAYEAFRRSGALGSDISFGGNRNKSMRVNLANIQKALDTVGPDGLSDYLLTKDTISNLKKVAKAQGEKFNVAYKNNMELPYAAIVFGPKLGAFYANLMGDTGYLTMDRWWSRTFNRYRGTLLTAPTEQGLARLKELITVDQRLNEPPAMMTDDEALAHAAKYVASYKAKGYKNGTEIERAANTVYKAAFEGLEDQPFNASDREFMINTTVKAQEKLAEAGVELTIADIQAVLWYYEKRLYAEMGARATKDVSYEEVVNEILAERETGGRVSGDGDSDASLDVNVEGTHDRSPAEDFVEEEVDPDTFYQTAPARPQTRTLFHGGPRLTPTAQLRAPLFLTSDRSGAEWFASERGDSQENTVREVSVSIDNPFVIDGPKDVAALARLLNDAGVEVQFTDGPYGWEWFAPDVSKHSPYDGTNPMDVSYIPAAREALLDAGYDAIEGLDVLENSEIPATVVLDPESSIVNDPDTFYQTAQEPGPGTPEFDAWFEGSQVVDENGDPLIVYHGTMMGGFTIFRTSEFAPGIFASSDRELAATYSDNVSSEAIPEPGRGLRPDSQVGVYPVFMSLKNPLVIDVEGDDWTDVPVPGGEPGQTASSNGIAEWAKEQGYDGVIFKNMRDVGPAAEDAPVSDIYAAFDSTQVKSVRNTGAFDPANPDILLQSENDFARGKIQFQSEGGDRFAGGRPIITLFDQKDLSTLIHENGHWVFEFFDTLSKESTADPSLVEDVATLREWLGAEPGAQLTRDQHEMMADGWLTWVYEGKAPIPELGRMFRRMAAWLTDIYTRARAAPDVQLNDEVRAVFERFLATEEAIAEAKAQPENRPLFTSPADIGMTEREWTPYARIAEDDDNAHRKLLTKVMDSVRKRRTKEYADERKRVRAEVADEVEQERKYRAWSILAKGTNPASVEGTPEGLLDMPDLQLDRDELVARFGGDDPDAMLSKVGKQRLGGRRNVYTAKAKSGTGIGLDEFAEAIGYQTAGEMVSELSTMRKLDDEIDARTDDIMEAEYPSGLDEGAIEEEAIALMHSSTKEQRLSTEARTLARRSGKSSKNLTHRVMRERAQRIIDGLEVRKIRSASFLRAERKAAREAQRAFSDVVRAGQEGTAKASEALRKAAEAKERQLLNHHLYMIARDAEKQVLRGRSDMQKYLTRQTVRQRIGQAHLELIEAVADKYSFRQSSQKNIDQMQRLVDYVANAPDDVLASMNIDPRVLVEANRKHYSRMTLSEFNGVVDTARNLAKLGRDQGVLESATERVLLSEALTAVEGSLSHHDVNKDSIRNAAGGFVRDVYTPDTIATIIDRGDEYGAFYEAVIKRVHLAQAEEQRLTTKTAKHLQDTVFHHLKGKSAADLHTGRLVPGGPKQEWTKSQIMVLALNYGTENGQQRVLDERVVDPAARLTENEALALMDTLDDTEWAFVESVWETFDGLWPQIAEVHQRRTRVKPVKEAGVEIRLPSGRVVQGNYYPIIYDPKAEQAASISFMDPVEMNMKGAGYATTARVANGMTIARASTGGGRSVSYEMTPMIGALRANIRYITMSEAVDNTSRVLRDVRTKNAFTRAGKVEDLKYLEAWLKDVATGAATSQAKWAQVMRFAKNNFTMSSLGANLKTIAMQPLGLAHTIQTIGLPATIRGLLSWVGKSEVTREGVMNLSSVMAERENTWQVAMTDFYTDAAAQAPTDMSRAQAAHAIMGKASFYLISKTQFIVDMITWQGAYDAALAQGHTQEEAIHRADRSVIRAQGGGLFADRSGLQRGTTEWGGTQAEVVKALTPLAGYMFTKWNRGRVSAARMAGQGYSPAAILRFTADLGVLFVLEGAIMAALWAWEADEDEYEDELLVEFLTAEVLSSTLGGIPFVKEGVSLWRGYGVEAPVYNPASAAFRFTAQLATAFEDMEIDKPDRFWKSFVNAGGALTGWPSVQINRLLAPAWDDDVGPANMAFGRNPTEER